MVHSPSTLCVITFYLVQLCCHQFKTDNHQYVENSQAKLIIRCQTVRPFQCYTHYILGLSDIWCLKCIRKLMKQEIDTVFGFDIRRNDSLLEKNDRNIFLQKSMGCIIRLFYYMWFKKKYTYLSIQHTYIPYQ